MEELSLKELLILKKKLDDIYYNDSTKESPYTDAEYDALVELIESKSSNIINKSVGAQIRDDDNRVKLPYYLGSLDKIKDKDVSKLSNWLKNNINDSYLLEQKLDGCSCLLISDGRGNIKIYTRGDGIVGADISHLVKYIINIPKRLKIPIVVRGELLLKKLTFDHKYSNIVSNARNMVSGLLNAKTIREGVNDIDFVAYEIIDGDIKKQSKPSNQLKRLNELGFKVVNNKKVSKIDIESLSEYLIMEKEFSEYDIDGIIVIPDVEYTRNVDKNPKYSFAFKMQLDSNVVEAEVENVLWNISKFGLLKPRVQIKPVNLNGVTITYTTGFNAKYIVEKSIGPGAIIKLTRSGDVIPFILEVIRPSKYSNLLPVDVKYKYSCT